MASFALSPSLPMRPLELFPCLGGIGKEPISLQQICEGWSLLEG
jgi:hypothetical protein